MLGISPSLVRNSMSLGACLWLSSSLSKTRRKTRGGAGGELKFQRRRIGRFTNLEVFSFLFAKTTNSPCSTCNIVGTGEGKELWDKSRFFFSSFPRHGSRSRFYCRTHPRRGGRGGETRDSRARPSARQWNSRHKRRVEEG